MNEGTVMDVAKLKSLKAELEALPPSAAVVTIERFFDGNDDCGSIGCNLSPYPGLDAFREKLIDLQQHPNVQAVYVRISEIDPGRDSWPFTDTVFVAGSLSIDQLSKILSPLRPDEVGPGEQFGIPEAITEKHGTSVLAAWWD